MAVTVHLYDSFAAKLANKEIDWDSDTIKLAGATSSYTPNQATHDYFDDITNEISGTGYTAGGATLASKTVALASHVQTFDAADVSWTSSSLTGRYFILYGSTGTASTSPLIGYVDNGTDYVSSTGTLTCQWNASGVFTITVS